MMLTRIAAAAAMMSFAGLAFVACGGKEAKGTKPASLAGGKEQKPPADQGSQTNDEELCPAEVVGYCVCVEGGFEYDGDIWDFACCEAVGVLGLYSCGDDAICNADTFACEEF
jgi:hypothetical protein